MAHLQKRLDHNFMLLYYKTVIKLFFKCNEEALKCNNEFKPFLTNKMFQTHFSGWPNQYNHLQNTLARTPGSENPAANWYGN